MTIVTERPERADSVELEKAKIRVRALTTTTIVLAVVLIGLGVWMVYDLVVTPDAGMTSEVEALLDDYTAAWNESDTDAFLGLVTDGYTFEFEGLPGVYSAESTARSFSSRNDWQVEILGEPLMIGEGPLYYLVTADHITETGSPDVYGISHYNVAEVDGVLKVQSHVFVQRS